MYGNWCEPSFSSLNPKTRAFPASDTSAERSAADATESSMLNGSACASTHRSAPVSESPKTRGGGGGGGGAEWQAIAAAAPKSARNNVSRRSLARDEGARDD